MADNKKEHKDCKDHKDHKNHQENCQENRQEEKSSSQLPWQNESYSPEAALTESSGQGGQLEATASADAAAGQQDLFASLPPIERRSQALYGLCEEPPRDGADLQGSGHRRGLRSGDLEDSRRRWSLLWLALPVATALAFWGGYIISPSENSCPIDQNAILYRQDGSRLKVHLKSLSDKKLWFSPLSEKRERESREKNSGERESGEKNSGEKRGGDKTEVAATPQREEVALERLRRIDLLADQPEDAKKPKPARVANQLSRAEKRFLGRYRASVTDHKAILHIYRTRRGRIGASLTFMDWGNQATEYLYGVHIRGRSIRFKRACSGKRCYEIGANRPIRQSFSGTLSADSYKISGFYKGGRNGSRWDAVKI